MPNELLQVSAVIAAGIVAKPGMDITDTSGTAKQIVALAKALIEEVAKNT